MTERDNLRDRIAELIDPNAWKMYRIPNMPGWSESTELIEPSREKAQAIIDEFGLTVVYAPAWDGEPSMSGEPHRMSVATEQQHRGNVENVITAWKDRSDKPNLRVESRVVGKWEKQ